MTDVMTEVVAAGTGRRAAVEGRQVAGKTGTAENFVDAGFTGYTPQYTTAVWVGFPDAQIPMEPPTTERDVTGGSYPAEIFALVMAAVHESLRAESFPASVPTTTTTQYPQVVEVPSVIDLPLEEATDAIEEAYLDVRVSEVVRDDVEPGTVVNQIPRATELASGGGAVIIEVAVEPPEPDPADLEAIELPEEPDGGPDAQDGEGLELEGLEAEGGGGQPGGAGQPDGSGSGEAGGGQ